MYILMIAISVGFNGIRNWLICSDPMFVTFVLQSGVFRTHGFWCESCQLNLSPRILLYFRMFNMYNIMYNNIMYNMFNMFNMYYSETHKL